MGAHGHIHRTGHFPHSGFLALIEVATRRVYIAGTKTNPTSAWTEQVVRNLTDCGVEFLLRKRYLILDREYLNRMIFVGPESLDRSISDYVTHCPALVDKSESKGHRKQIAEKLLSSCDERTVSSSLYNWRIAEVLPAWEDTFAVEEMARRIWLKSLPKRSREGNLIQKRATCSPTIDAEARSDRLRTDSRHAVDSSTSLRDMLVQLRLFRPKLLRDLHPL